MKILKPLLIVSLLSPFLATTACFESETENKVEDVGEKIEETTKDAAENVQDAAGDVNDKVNN